MAVRHDQSGPISVAYFLAIAIAVLLLIAGIALLLMAAGGTTGIIVLLLAVLFLVAVPFILLAGEQ